MDPAHVLLVEDDEPFRLGLRSTLSLAGYRVTDFGSARPAMASLNAAAATQEPPVDLVLADLRLPDLDGLELLQQMQEHDADLPVVVMTAHADIETAVRAIRLGAYDFVEKALRPGPIADPGAKGRAAAPAGAGEPPPAQWRGGRRRPGCRAGGRKRGHAPCARTAACKWRPPRWMC
jgi:CheY-like chemotaxis protein